MTCNSLIVKVPGILICWEGKPGNEQEIYSAVLCDLSLSKRVSRVWEQATGIEEIQAVEFTCKRLLC